MDTSPLFPALALLITAVASLVKLMWAQFHLSHPETPALIDTENEPIN